MSAQPPALAEPNKQLSIISLILGILSVSVCWIFAAVPAVITGHIALNKMKRTPAEFAGKGMAIAGLVMGYIAIAMSLTLIPASLLLPALAKAKQRAQRAQCVNNLKQVMIGAIIYAEEHDRTFPPNFLSMSNSMATPRILVCPGDRKKRDAAVDWTSYSEENTSYEFLTPGIKLDTLKEPVPSVHCPIHNADGMSDGSAIIKGSRRSQDSSR